MTLRPLPAQVVAYMAARCCDLLGRTRMAAAVDLDVEDMRRVSCGLVVPSARQREIIESHFAGLLGCELEASEWQRPTLSEDKRSEPGSKGL